MPITIVGCSPRRGLAGFTLLECMLALASTFMLLTAMISLSITLQKNRADQEALTLIANNAQLAINALKNALRAADNLGCRRPGANFTAPQSFGLQGDSGVLTISGVAPARGNLRSAMTENTLSILYATPHPQFTVGDWLLIADCFHADLRQISQVSMAPAGQRIVTAFPLSKAYTPTATLARWQRNTFYSAPTGKMDEHGQPTYALYVRNQRGRHKLLGADVAAVNFAYAMADGSMRAVTAAAFDGSNVRGVRLTLRMRHYPFTKTWYSYLAV